MRPLDEHVARAGFTSSTPLAVARVDGDGTVEALSAGHWHDGQAVATDDRFYVASLAKQVTGTVAALLVRDGRLDPDQPASNWLDDLPDWAAAITPRQLAHHIAGLPAAGELEPRSGGNWTEAVAMAALHAAGPLCPAGQRYAYSNLGYVLLARIVAVCAAMPFAEFVAAHLFAPHRLSGIGFTSDVTRFPQAALMGPSLPLTHGDGGLWATAPGFARWLHLNNRDAFSLGAITEAAGQLDDGSRVDYGWGIGLRQHRGRQLFIHGGAWTGAVAKAVRCPALGVGVVAVAAGAPFEAVEGLVASLLSDH